MSEVLYRKYRSQTFDELVGQEHITDILKKSVVSGQISHAYLFVGSRGTGKTSSARILAKSLNCTDLRKDGNPCGVCDRCKAIASGTYLDLIEIDAASNRGIDQIRELKERIEFSPTEGKYKIYIIDEVHMLTTEAFNALLKTLEEPPSHVIFMLATTDVHKLPATILSRCQRYDFRLGSEDQIRLLISDASEKENVKLTDEALNVLVQNANGSYRDALSLLDVVVSSQLGSEDPSEVSGEEVRRFLGIPDSTMVYYLLEKLSERDAVAALDLVKELDQKGVDLQQFVKYILASLREILVAKMTGDETEYTFSQNLSVNDTVKYINHFLDAEKKLRTAAIPLLVIELVIAELTIISGTSADQHQSRANKDTNSATNSSKAADMQKITDKTEKGSTEKKASDDKSTNNNEKKSKESLEKSTNESSKEGLKASEKRAPKEIESETKVSEENSNKINDITIDQIEGSWGEITNKVQKFNGHLYAFLKAAKVSAIEHGHLILEVPFEFHKERIEAMKSRDAINDIFRDIFGVTLPIRCDVNQTIQRKRSSSADVILQKAPKPAEVSSSEKDKSRADSSSSERKPVYQRKTSKRVEALFADL